jgi:hypothetical protein
MISFTHILCINIITSTSLEINNAHNLENKKSKTKTMTSSKQSEIRNNDGPTSVDDVSTQKKLLHNDVFKKITMHKHHRRSV